MQSLVAAILVISSVSTSGLNAQVRQELSLLEAYELLEEQYPNLRNSEVLQQAYAHELEDLDKTRLPEIYVKADSRLQSENIKFIAPEGQPAPFEFELPLFSAKAMLEMRYDILDGGMNKAQQSLKAAQLSADMQSIEVEKYGLREHVNTLFLNISLLRDQARLLNFSLDELNARKSAVEAGVEYGVMLPSEVSRISVRELELTAMQSDIDSRISGMIKTLSSLLGTDIPDDVELQFPALPDFAELPETNRPESDMFKLQREALYAQSDMIDVKRRPRLSAYAQGGVGYPNPVNFFDTEVAPFGIIGVQFAWMITDWKKNELEKELLTLRAQQIQNAEETFNFNIDTKEANYLSEVDRLLSQTETDLQIAELQSDILDQVAAQLEEGVITSAEYIQQVNADLSARQQLLVHQTELLKLQLNFWNSRGGF